MDYEALRAEITGDPTGLGYAAAVARGDDTAVAALLNAPRAGVSVQRELVPAHEVFEAIAPPEWAALSAAEKQRVQTILSMGTVNVRGAQTRAALAAAFGAGTATRTALVALQARTGSRAEAVLGAGVGVHEADVARALRG